MSWEGYGQSGTIIQNNKSFRNKQKQIVFCMTTITPGVIQLYQPLEKQAVPHLKF